ncbi:MAG: SDR family oxidoreductase [Trueperaceae bacterium]
MSRDLAGSVAFITGGGRGIGRAAAIALAAAGASAAVAARNGSEVDAVADEIRSHGVAGFAAQADVTDRGAVHDAARAAEAALGPIDVLICNAGTGQPPAPSWEVDPEAWWRVQEVNVLGALHTVQALVPGMVTRGRGRVVHVASLLGSRPTPGISAYACSKASQMRLADTLDGELAGTGVRSFAISPGLVRTAMTAEMEKHVDVPEDAWTGIDASADLIVRIASGHADPLSGRMLHVEDDLDDLVRHADTIDQRGWYQLRIFRGRAEEGPA